jgi:hypothetical protein
LPASRWAKTSEEGETFSFSFSIFQSHFPKDFESSFEFESNHSIQNIQMQQHEHKHVSTLIFDFKLIKIIIILSLYAHKIA